MNAVVLQLIRFGLVGFVNTALGLLAIFTLMYVFNVSPGFANAGGYGLGLFISYLLNRAWTFQNNKSVSNTLPRFLAVTATSYVMNLGIVLLAIHKLHINAYTSQLIGVLAYTGLTFLGCRLLVFK